MGQQSRQPPNHLPVPHTQRRLQRDEAAATYRRFALRLRILSIVNFTVPFTILVRCRLRAGAMDALRGNAIARQSLACSSAVQELRMMCVSSMMHILLFFPLPPPRHRNPTKRKSNMRKHEVSKCFQHTHKRFSTPGCASYCPSPPWPNCRRKARPRTSESLWKSGLLFHSRVNFPGRSAAFTSSGRRWSPSVQRNCTKSTL